MRVTLTTSGAGRQHEVSVDSAEFVIGRAGDCNLQLRNPLISRHHCVLKLEDDGVYVCDLGSSNGTGVNNQRLAGRRRLRDGDTLWVAATPLSVRVRREWALARVKDVARAMTRAFRPPAATAVEESRPRHAAFLTLTRIQGG